VNSKDLKRLRGVRSVSELAISWFLFIALHRLRVEDRSEFMPSLDHRISRKDL
jgi:hypothetical protein